MTQEQRQKAIIRTSLVGIATNIVLAAFKAVVGLLSHSIAIVLDSVNNLSDVLSSIITVIGTKLAGRPADKEHPFGHGRYEYISAAVISVIILYAGFTALVESVKTVINPQTPDYSTASLIIVSLAVLVKIALGLFVKKRGKTLHSDSLNNSGQDALQDALISGSTLAAAIVFLLSGLSLEAWLGVVISLLIIKAGIDMIRETISKLLGERVDSELSKQVKQTICETEGVAGAYDLIMNSYGPDRWLASVHIEVPDTWTAEKIDIVSREIFQRVAEKNQVILTAIGIYSQNTSDDEAKSIRTRITELVMSESGVLQIHGFYYHPSEKTIRFDVVTDYLVPDTAELMKTIRCKVQAEYPEYKLHIHQDSDVSD